MNEQVEKKDLEKLIQENYPRLRSFINNRIYDKDDAEDVLQDVFYKLIISIKNVFNPIQQVDAWLYKVAHNIIINKSRKKKEERLPIFRNEDDVLMEFSEVLFSNDNPTPDMEYLRSHIEQEIAIALQELPAEQREVFELMELDGLSAKEISESLGVPVNTVLSRKHYAVKYLRKRLETLYNDIINQ